MNTYTIKFPFEIIEDGDTEPSKITISIKVKAKDIDSAALAFTSSFIEVCNVNFEVKKYEIILDCTSHNLNKVFLNDKKYNEVYSISDKEL